VKVSRRRSQARLFQPNWTAEFSGVQGPIVGNSRLFAVLAESEAVASVDVMDGRVTILGRMPPLSTAESGDLSCNSLDLGCSTYEKGRLLINWFDKVVVMDAQNGAWHTYQGPPDAALVKSPLVVGDHAFCLWGFKNQTAQVTRLNLSDLSSGHSPILVGEAFHQIQGDHSGLFIGLRAKQREAPGRLYRLNSHSLQIEAECAMPLVKNEQGFLATEQHVFIPLEAFIRINPKGPYHEVAPESVAKKGVARVLGWSDAGTRAAFFLSCYEPEHLELVRSWPLPSNCEFLSELPGTPGVVITLEKPVFETSVEVLLPTHPETMEIGEWPGAATQAPVFFGNRAYWVADLGGLSWLESRTREARPQRAYDTEFHIADLVRGEHRVLGLNLGNRGTRLVATDGRVVLATGRQLIQFDADALWEAAVLTGSTGLSRVVSALREAPERRVGTGPRGPEWGYQHETPVLHSLLDDFLEFPDAFWAASVDDRLTAMRTIIDGLTRTVLAHWPDTDALIARAFPVSMLEESTPAQRLTKLPFGNLGVNASLLKKILDWRKGAEICQKELPAGIAERVSRLLLHEHIRRCANQMTWVETHRHWNEAKAITRETMDQVTLQLHEALAWCNADSIDLTSASEMLSHFVRSWPHGAPPFEGNLGRYVQFLDDCLRYRLICAPAPNSVAAAVLRCWRCVFNPVRKSVFVSYSSRNAEEAERLAVALRDRTLKVGLDRWEIAPDLEERSVQMWIAESIMSTDARVILLSAEALKSGWVQLETEWERRLLGARRAFSLPYLVLLDDRLPLSFETYPPGRVIAISLMNRDPALVADEFALRIVLDWLAYVCSIKKIPSRA
jgi:hypothetical protein